VHELVELAFAEIRLDWKQYLEVDSRYFRPTEIDALQGDASKARQRLGWQRD
jgi:GDPmannose 4,6-dehydratase